jgi:patatin-like phospholipase
LAHVPADPRITRPERSWTDHAATVAGGAAALFLLGLVPQVRGVIFQLPLPGHGPPAAVLGFYGLLVGLGLLNVALLIAVVPREDGRAGRFSRSLEWPFSWLGRRPRTAAAVLLSLGAGLLFARSWWGPRLGQVPGPAGRVPALDAAGLFALAAGLGLALPRAIGPRPARALAARTWTALLITFVLGELVWFACGALPGVLSPRNFSIWALFEVAFLLVLAGRVLDAAHRLAPMNLRPWFVVALLIGAPFAEREDVGQVGVDQIDENRPPESTWLEALEARLNALPAEGPVLVLAASGGGARAALFTSLVLEGLARAEVEGGTFADRLLLVSSVSGGSLACAYYAATFPEPPRTTLHSSFERELAAGLVEFARDAADAAGESDGRVDPGVFDRTLDLCVELERAVREGTPYPDLPLDFKSAFADAMSADHMAPVLRGILLPGLGRGEALVRNWEQAFGWGAVDNLGWSRPDRPLLLLGATHAQRGRRLALGFPPLASPWIADELDTLGARDPNYRIRLAEAVRVSAGFPWLMPVARLAVPTEDLGGALDTDGLHLVDGGVVDNTGVDTLVALFRRLASLASRGDGASDEVERARRLLARLRARGVLLLEIDSGAKKRGLSTASRWLPGLEPVEALQVALDANATMAARAGVDELRGLLRRPARAPLEPAESALTHVVISADRFVDVMTAWALTPKDKAALWGTFLFGFPPTLQDLTLGYWYHRRAAEGERELGSVAARTLSAEERAWMRAVPGDLQARLDRHRAARGSALALLAPPGSSAHRGARVASELSAHVRGEPAAPRLVGVVAGTRGGDGQRVWLELDGGEPLDLEGWRLRTGEGVSWELGALDGRLEPGERRPILRRGRGVPLAPQGGTLELMNPAGRVVDRWTYGPGSPGRVLKRE